MTDGGSPTKARRATVPVRVGSVVIGGAAPIAVQTMTKTQTEDAAATIAQIQRAANGGRRRHPGHLRHARCRGGAARDRA